MMFFKIFLVFLLSNCVAPYELGHAYDDKGRITGGDVAHENQFPYQVGISIECQVGQFTWCGGSLISQHWVITAAHCVDNIVRLTMHLGSVNRLEPAHVVQPSLQHIHLHPYWQRSTLENDIALIYMPQAVKFTANIRAVALPRLVSTYSTYVYREAIAIGWGRLNDYSTAISNELRYVIRYVDSNEDCQRVYGAAIRASNLCIDTTGGKSTCTGDSGGPLVIQDAHEGEILIGLTSFGKKSGCTKGYPAVFTRITSYLDWIRDVSGVAHY